MVAAPAECLALQDVGDEGERDTTGRRRRHRYERVAAVLELDRLAPPRPVTLQIAEAHDPSPALHLSHDQRRRGARIEASGPALGDAGEHAREVLVVESLALGG